MTTTTQHLPNSGLDASGAFGVIVLLAAIFLDVSVVPSLFASDIENKLSAQGERFDDDRGAVTCRVDSPTSRRCTVEFPSELGLPSQEVILEKAEFPAPFSWYRSNMSKKYRVTTSFNGEALPLSAAKMALSTDVTKALAMAYGQVPPEQYGRAMNRASYK